MGMNRKISTFATRKRFAEALKVELATKPLDKISVSNLVRRTGINRKTFYYHFDDIYQLVGWILRTEAMDHILTFNVLLDYRKGISFVLDYIESNQNLIANIMCSPARGEVRELLCGGVQESLDIAMRKIERARKEKLDPDFREFVVDFFTEAITGMIARWAENPERRSREQIESYLNRIFDELIASIKAPKNSSLSQNVK